PAPGSACYAGLGGTVRLHRWLRSLFHTDTEFLIEFCDDLLIRLAIEFHLLQLLLDAVGGLAGAIQNFLGASADAAHGLGDLFGPALQVAVLLRRFLCGRKLF